MEIIKNQFYISIKSLLNELRATIKKGEANSIYRAIRELLKFGEASGLIDETTFSSYLFEARDALPFNR